MIKNLKVPDPSALLEASEHLEKAITQDPPYVFEFIDLKGKKSIETVGLEEHFDLHAQCAYQKIKEFLDLYTEWALDILYQNTKKY